jgi:predicted DNA-binding transcriptional regulator YafY
MAKSPARAQLSRLDQLKGTLKARDHCTARELAAELGVSLRTLYRDVELLRDAGVPIESDRGRGGGLRIQRNWALGQVHFSAEEAIGLLLSMAVAEQMGSTFLLRPLSAARRKLAAAFSESYQSKIKSLRRRVLIGAPASPQIVATLNAPQPNSLVTVSEAFFGQRCLDISYIDQAGTRTSRIVEPQFLYLSRPAWYILAFDHRREDIRSFRLDRIERAKTLDKPFRLARPEPYLAAAESGIATL